MRRYAAILLLLAGCDLYFGGDDEPPPCTGWGTGGGEGASPSQQLRNPETGECESFGGWGGCYDYNNGCAPCDYAALTQAQPDWGSCYSKCDGLDEQSCLGSSGCIAAYDEDTDYQDAPSVTTFKGCWATPLSGPIQGGDCWNLGAQECSRHDDCSMYFGDGYGNDTPMNAIIAGQGFSHCAPEPTTQGCTNVNCGPGSHCEDQCYPCDGQVVCATPPPACPTGTVAGRVNGCWSGFCIPQSDCPMIACESLTSEASCLGRPECTPVYGGSNCTCSPNGGCTCQDLTFERCETWWL